MNLTLEPEHVNRMCCGTMTQAVREGVVGLEVLERKALRTHVMEAGVSYKAMNKCPWCGRGQGERHLGPTEPLPPTQPVAAPAPAPVPPPEPTKEPEPETEPEMKIPDYHSEEPFEEEDIEVKVSHTDDGDVDKVEVVEADFKVEDAVEKAEEFEPATMEPQEELEGSVGAEGETTATPVEEEKPKPKKSRRGRKKKSG